MALATRCPNCHALFRVVADQLKLRGGLVRCGACQHVFDAIGTLSYIDDSVLATTPPAEGTLASTAGGAAAVAAPAAPVAVTETEFAPGHSFAPEVPSIAESTPGVADFAEEATSPSLTEKPHGAGVATTRLEDVAASAASTEELAGTGPAGHEAATTHGDDAMPSTVDAGAPAFLREDARPTRRRYSIVFGGGSVVLALLALVQLAVLFRADILVAAPSARPVLTQVCRVFRCTVDWPARSDLLAVVGSELQSLPGTGAFELTAVVRNRGSFTLALPAIELTLTDTLNRTVARKVFLPNEYLSREPDPVAHVLAGLEAGADLTIRIAFESHGLNAAGFVVYPFYL